MKVWLLQRAAKFPEGVYPVTHPRVQVLPLLEEEGQFPGVRGKAGVGWEQVREPRLNWQNPVGVEKAPREQVTVRLPLAMYPEMQPRVQGEPEGIEPVHPPMARGERVEGFVQGEGLQVLDEVEKVPAVQVMVRSPEGVYPDWQVGVQVDPEGVEAEQEE
jgi:hypothetical protein